MLQIESYIPDAFSSSDCVDYMSDHFEAGENNHVYWGCVPVVRTGGLCLYNSCTFRRNDKGAPLYDLKRINSNQRRYRITSQHCPEDSDENLKLLFLLYSTRDISLFIEDSDKVIFRGNGEWFIEGIPASFDLFFFYSKGWYVSFGYLLFMDCICHKVTNFAVEEDSSLDSLEAII